MWEIQSSIHFQHSNNHTNKTTRETKADQQDRHGASYYSQIEKLKTVNLCIKYLLSLTLLAVVLNFTA
jgi:hypothetical protein